MDYINFSKVTLHGADGSTDSVPPSLVFKERKTKGGARAFYASASLKGGFSAEKAITVSLGIPDTSDFLAIENHSLYWCRPFWSDSLKGLPSRVQLLLIKDGKSEPNGAKWRAYLPVCADTFKSLIFGDAGGASLLLYANTEGITECREQLSLIYMEGDDPYLLLNGIASEAAALLGNGLKLREERSYPESLEYLGWCSWDAFQIRVNHEGLLQKSAEFKEKQVPIGFAIIDDMWADAPNLENIPMDAEFMDMVHAMHASTLRAFEGAPRRFPKGMRAAVSSLRESGIKNIGIWFPTTGYWSGIEKGSALEAELSDVLVDTEAGKRIVSPEKERAEKYFDILCGTVKDFGADFVKIDNQGFHTQYRNIAPIGQSAGAIQSAIDRASEKYFDRQIIHCMGMPSECLFNRVDGAVCRCSDDFIPENKAWFLKNILQCSYNGLLQGQFHVNDWDMWWTDDGQAVKNSLCRAISGGPIYVSDKLGRTNPEILKPLCLSDGRILRGDISAVPTEDCLVSDPAESKSIFKVFNRVEKSGVVAVFNINEKGEAVSGRISAEDCRLPKGRYAYYEYFGKVGGILEKGETIDVTLDTNDDFRLYTLVPLTDGVAVIGRTDLFMGVKAAERHESTVSLAEGGEIVLISEGPVKITVSGEEINVRRDGALTYVTLEKEQKDFVIG